MACDARLAFLELLDGLGKLLVGGSRLIQFKLEGAQVPRTLLVVEREDGGLERIDLARIVLALEQQLHLQLVHLPGEELNGLGGPSDLDGGVIHLVFVQAGDLATEALIAVLELPLLGEELRDALRLLRLQDAVLAALVVAELLHALQLGAVALALLRQELQVLPVRLALVVEALRTVLVLPVLFG